MLIDARSLPAGMTLRADVVVVGAGPAGITLAEELSRGHLRVLLLESGNVQPGRSASRLLRGDSVGAPFPLVASRQRGFSGAANRWTATTGLRVRPLDPVDLEARPGLSRGWPLTVEDLLPDYEAAYRSLDLAPHPASHPSHHVSPGDEPACDCLEGDRSGRALFRFADRRVFLDRLERLADSPCVDVTLNATVTNIDVDPDNGLVTGIEVTPTTGAATAGAHTVRVAGRAYVLAGGALENARMLLASPGRTGAGVGNESDNVGRYLQEHISADTGLIRGPGASSFPMHPFTEHRVASGDKVQQMLWIGEDAIHAEGLLNAAFWAYRIDPRYLSPSVQSLRALRRGLSAGPRTAHGRHHLRSLARDPASVLGFTLGSLGIGQGEQVIGLRVMAEQVPDRDSRVTLSKRRDALGVPRLQVDWRVSSTDLEMVRAHQETLSRMVQAEGLGPIDWTLAEAQSDQARASTFVNYHHIGTTRMGVDERDSVVDPAGRVHSSPNLYVTGSSLFPTGGYVNPTLTIIALAFRLARALRQELRPIAA